MATSIEKFYRGIMPHVVIDYSENLSAQVSPSALLENVHQSLLQSELFSPDSIRLRAKSFEDFCLGAEKQNFLHVCIKLFAGRSDQQKAQLTQLVSSQLQQLSLADVIVSCECVDIDKECYQQFSL